MKIYDWNKITDKQRRDFSTSLKMTGKAPIFVIGSISMSEKRIKQLAAQLGKKAPILWGVLKDEYIQGLEESQQFKAMTLLNLTLAISKLGEGVEVNVIEYFQRDWKHVLKELEFSAVILINGSWHRQLHQREEFWIIVNKKLQYRIISPFSSENEAKAYVGNFLNTLPELVHYDDKKVYTDGELIKLANDSARASFDWTFQTGCVLASKGKVLLSASNKVMPYDTFAMHNGSSREKNFTPLGDSNNYDTNHAEMEILAKALEFNIDLTGTSLYVNLMPCPTCARMLARTQIKEFVYSLDHSDGYGIKMLESSGKVIRRVLI